MAGATSRVGLNALHQSRLRESVDHPKVGEAGVLRPLEKSAPSGWEAQRTKTEPDGEVGSRPDAEIAGEISTVRMGSPDGEVRKKKERKKRKNQKESERIRKNQKESERIKFEDRA